MNRDGVPFANLDHFVCVFLRSVPRVWSGLQLRISDQCDRPSLRFCSGHVPYDAVPRSLTDQYQFVEFSVKSWVRDTDGNEKCKRTLTKALCKQRFPACSLQKNRVIFEADSNCEVDLLENCYNLDRIAVNEICSNYTTILYRGSCSPISYLSRKHKRPILACNQESDEKRLTDWMFRFLTLMDTQIMRDISNTLQQYAGPYCYPAYLKYRCDYGFCEDDRVISMNTKEFCNMGVLGW